MGNLEERSDLSGVSVGRDFDRRAVLRLTLPWACLLLDGHTLGSGITVNLSAPPY